jgi:membrane-bound metal-dependent hydrolase YbcI (DUF457 family)
VPFTPFHLGPASILALALLRYAYLPAILLGSIAPDIQPLIIIFFNQTGTLHGPLLHSFLGSTILLALPLTAIVFILKKPLQTITSFLKLNQKPTLKTILIGTLIGLCSHILLDTPLYTDIQPFYPITQNPLLSHNPNTSHTIYTACTTSFIIALAMYTIILWKKQQQQKTTKNNQNKQKTTNNTKKDETTRKKNQIDKPNEHTKQE